MLLRWLRPRIIEMSMPELRAFISRYRDERMADINTYKENISKKEKLVLTDDEKALMKKLGLSMRTLQAFATATQNNLESEDESDVEPDA